MATTKTTTKAKTTTAKAETKKEPVVTETKKKIKIADDVRLDVRSNVFGNLVYVNTRNHEEFHWAETGEIQVMTMKDLRDMKATQIGFFEANMISVVGADEDGIEPEDVYEDLYVTKYYKNQIGLDDYVGVCQWDTDTIKEKIPLLTTGAKRNLAVALNDLIADGTLDSMKRIKAFEEVLGCSLATPE